MSPNHQAGQVVSVEPRNSNPNLARIMQRFDGYGALGAALV
jgi:hypothetical protein